jgi:1-acyl-sn-glycerol-3-phosphate acyltransferase
MSDSSHELNKERPAHNTAEVLLDLIQSLAIELHHHKRSALSATLDSSLEGDFGLDSLGRAELLLRVERAFGVRLSEEILVTAETPRDLLRAVHATDATRSLVAGTPRKSVALDEAEGAPVQAMTVTEVLDWHVRSHPARTHIYLYEDAEKVQEITYADLRAGAAAGAGGLQERGLQPGQAVAIMLPTCREFFESFYGVLLAGGIPVPIYPPLRRSQIEDHLRRQATILRNARVSILITVAEAQRVARLLGSQVEGLRHIVTVSDLAATRGAAAWPIVQAQDIAFLQYTSGSTGDPKGVILTHANLLANLRAMGQVAHTTSRDVCVSWLPLYHDMGLIGAWLGSLYYACPLVLMSPLTFLARPERWLWAIHTHRGTFSAAPNFAYELCLRKIEDRDIEGLDLSSWRMALNGAEPISPETVVRFCERFARYGFRAEAMAPVYGLAEASLGLAFSSPGRGAQIDRIAREPFLRSGRAVPAEDADASALRFVACGQPLPGHQIRIVDATGYEVPERQVGRLEFRGPSVTSGYFRNPEETRRLFHGEWLDSGDLAYIARGEVYLTGRAKDLIIRAGRNIYPQELEEAIGDLPGIRKGCVAVFGSPDPVSGTERVIALAETRETEPTAMETLRGQVEATAMDLLGTPIDQVVLAPPYTVLKTSSGKIRRAASRERYERGRLAERQRAVWWQVTRLAFAGILPQLRRGVQQGVTLLTAAYLWGVFGMLAPVVWVAVALLPRLAWRREVVRALARLLLRLFGIPLLVQGREHLPRDSAYVVVVNHASYLDALVLVAVLPSRLSYVAKRELADRFVSRVLFQRLGTLFVERFDPQQGIEDTGRVAEVVRQGCPVVFFPEGTLSRIPGLRPFRMGAFVVAAQAGVPVVPVALSGTRSILRDGQWLPRRGIVRIEIGPPLLPQGHEWSAAIALRDATRVHILHACAEPDLADTYVAE